MKENEEAYNAQKYELLITAELIILENTRKWKEVNECGMIYRTWGRFPGFSVACISPWMGRQFILGLFLCLTSEWTEAI